MHDPDWQTEKVKGCGSHCFPGISQIKKKKNGNKKRTMVRDSQGLSI